LAERHEHIAPGAVRERGKDQIQVQLLVFDRALCSAAFL
jgi:hypothetical protein